VNRSGEDKTIWLGRKGKRWAKVSHGREDSERRTEVIAWLENVGITKEHD
jgi:hypothetical protein